MALKSCTDYQRVVEIGMGRWSTSWLAGCCREVDSFEHDPDYCAFASERPGHQVHRGFDWVQPATRKEDLSAEQLQTLESWYRNRRPDGPIDLLFVDGAHVDRQLALDVFSPQARLIVLHDWCYNSYYRSLPPAGGPWQFARDRLLYPQTCVFWRVDRNGAAVDRAAFYRALRTATVSWLLGLIDEEFAYEPLPAAMAIGGAA